MPMRNYSKSILRCSGAAKQLINESLESWSPLILQLEWIWIEDEHLWTESAVRHPSIHIEMSELNIKGKCSCIDSYLAWCWSFARSFWIKAVEVFSSDKLSVGMSGTGALSGTSNSVPWGASCFLRLVRIRSLAANITLIHTVNCDK